MKIKSFLAMMAVAAIAFGVSSCSKDDDEEVETDLATQVIGTYTGDEIMVVMGIGDTTQVSYEFAKNAASAIDITIPASGEGTMSFPALPVKGIQLTKSGSDINGSIDSYAGTVLNASGVEKSYTVSKLSVGFSGKTVALAYTLQYGTMPMAMTTTFSGTKK